MEKIELALIIGSILILSGAIVYHANITITGNVVEEGVEGINPPLDLNDKILLMDAYEKRDGWFERNIFLGYNEDIDNEGIKTAYLFIDVSDNPEIGSQDYWEDIDYIKEIIDSLFLTLYEVDNNADEYVVVYSSKEPYEDTSSVKYEDDYYDQIIYSYSNHLNIKNLYEEEITRDNFMRNIVIRGN